MIAFLGTGLMGLHMARNLAEAGHTVVAWNRTRSKAEPLTAHGVRIADSTAEAVSGASIIISMLSDGAASAQVQSGQELRGALSADAVWIEMGSIKPDEAHAHASDLASLGVKHVDAPVSGGTKAAEAGTLAIMAGGAAEDFEAVKPALEAMGRPVLVGPSGSGQLAKLANQAIVASTIGAVAEAMLLLEKGGADPAAVREALKGGFADSTILQLHGARMTTRDFEPGGLSRLQLKDIENALAEARAVDLNLPQTQAVRDRFERFCNDLGGSEKDHSGLFLELLDLNGISA